MAHNNNYAIPKKKYLLLQYNLCFDRECEVGKAFVSTKNKTNKANEISVCKL